MTTPLTASALAGDKFPVVDGKVALDLARFCTYTPTGPTSAEVALRWREFAQFAAKKQCSVDVAETENDAEVIRVPVLERVRLSWPSLVIGSGSAPWPEGRFQLADGGEVDGRVLAALMVAMTEDAFKDSPPGGGPQWPKGFVGPEGDKKILPAFLYKQNEPKKEEHKKEEHKKESTEPFYGRNLGVPSRVLASHELKLEPIPQPPEGVVFNAEACASVLVTWIKGNVDLTKSALSRGLLGVEADIGSFTVTRGLHPEFYRRWATPSAAPSREAIESFLSNPTAALYAITSAPGDWSKGSKRHELDKIISKLCGKVRHELSLQYLSPQAREGYLAPPPRAGVAREVVEDALQRCAPEHVLTRWMLIRVLRAVPQSTFKVTEDLDIERVVIFELSDKTLAPILIGKERYAIQSLGDSLLESLRSKTFEKVVDQMAKDKAAAIKELKRTRPNDPEIKQLLLPTREEIGDYIIARAPAFFPVIEVIVDKEKKSKDGDARELSKKDDVIFNLLDYWFRKKAAVAKSFPSDSVLRVAEVVSMAAFSRLRISEADLVATVTKNGLDKGFRIVDGGAGGILVPYLELLDTPPFDASSLGKVLEFEALKVVEAFARAQKASKPAEGEAGPSSPAAAPPPQPQIDSPRSPDQSTTSSTGSSNKASRSSLIETARETFVVVLRKGVDAATSPAVLVGDTPLFERLKAGVAVGELLELDSVTTALGVIEGTIKDCGDRFRDNATLRDDLAFLQSKEMLMDEVIQAAVSKAKNIKAVKGKGVVVISPDNQKIVELWTRRWIPNPAPPLRDDVAEPIEVVLATHNVLSPFLLRNVDLWNMEDRSHVAASCDPVSRLSHVKQHLKANGPGGEMPDVIGLQEVDNKIGQLGDIKTSTKELFTTWLETECGYKTVSDGGTPSITALLAWREDRWEALKVGLAKADGWPGATDAAAAKTARPMPFAVLRHKTDRSAVLVVIAAHFAGKPGAKGDVIRKEETQFAMHHLGTLAAEHEAEAGTRVAQVFMGDTNYSPADDCYAIATSQFASAYRAVAGDEPKCTNWGFFWPVPPACTDFIFGKGLAFTDVLESEDKAIETTRQGREITEWEGWPDAFHPSDHLLLMAKAKF